MINDAEKLCNYLEDQISSLLSSSDRGSLLDESKLPFGYDQINWSKRTAGVKSQEKIASYLSAKLTDKVSSDGEPGVIESRVYKVDKLEDKTERTTLQVRGRESFKEK